MSQSYFNNLAIFIAVAREKSFTRAAAYLGVSQSAVSHSIRGLEDKLGIRLLTRTTRGAELTEAGNRLLENLTPYYEGIEAELAALGELREKPSGTIRLTAHDHPATTILWPKLSKLILEYPDITFEINVDYALTDIVAKRFDAGVRLGNQVSKDMIAFRISPDFRMVVAGSAAYFERYPIPITPHDLTSHNCANLRLSTHGDIYAWDFIKNGKELRVQGSGQMIFNNSSLALNAALEGYGLVYAPEDVVTPYIQAGHLIQVLDDWSPTFPGYHMYYPSRKQTLPAFRLVIDALRY